MWNLYWNVRLATHERYFTAQYFSSWRVTIFWSFTCSSSNPGFVLQNMSLRHFHFSSRSEYESNVLSRNNGLSSIDVIKRSTSEISSSRIWVYSSVEDTLKSIDIAVWLVRNYDFEAKITYCRAIITAHGGAIRIFQSMHNNGGNTYREIFLTRCKVEVHAVILWIPRGKITLVCCRPYCLSNGTLSTKLVDFPSGRFRSIIRCYWFTRCRRLRRSFVFPQQSRNRVADGDSVTLQISSPPRFRVFSRCAPREPRERYNNNDDNGNYCYRCRGECIARAPDERVANKINHHVCISFRTASLLVRARR